MNPAQSPSWASTDGVLREASARTTLARNITPVAPDGASLRPRAGSLTYALTPPRVAHSVEKRREVADKQMQRLAGLPLDAVVIYDIQDEGLRTNLERPYPFVPRLDAAEYAQTELQSLKFPKVVYSGVAHKSLCDIEQIARGIEASHGAFVLVGAASKTQSVQTPLLDAQHHIQQRVPGLAVGGVVIAERHRDRGAEEVRVLEKVSSGCSFFVSQTVYCGALNRQLLKDLAVACEKQCRPAPTLLFTLSPAGSARTFEFLQWLGVHVPHSLQHRLLQAQDPLQASLQACADLFYELWAYADLAGVPIGCNVESVALSAAEVDASLELVHQVARIMGRSRTAPF